FAAKSITLPGDWWKPWGTEDTAVWNEAHRLTECWLASIIFKQAAQRAAIDIHPFHVLPSYLFNKPNQSTWLGQPWVEGTSDLTSLRIDSFVLLTDTLAAFAHHTFHVSSGEKVHCDF
ncbi:hypothetical protein BV22DRAFT_993198, partial [Leucogyrophana mollusca]